MQFRHKTLQIIIAALPVIGGCLYAYTSIKSELAADKTQLVSIQHSVDRIDRSVASINNYLLNKQADNVAGNSKAW